MVPRSALRRRRKPARSRTAPRGNHSLGGWRPRHFPEWEADHNVKFCLGGGIAAPLYRNAPSHTPSERSNPKKKGIIISQIKAAASVDRLGHLWITKYHLFLNTTIIMGYSVVTGASDRPGKMGTLKASGCWVGKYRLILVKISNEDCCSLATACCPAEKDNQQVDTP